MSRRAIRNMNHLYPDVTPEELANSDSTCIICREEMTSGAKRLPCNHIFHTLCLRSWFQRQQTCPTCRLDVLQTAQPQNAGAAAAAAQARQAPAANGQARAPQAGANEGVRPPPVGKISSKSQNSPNTGYERGGPSLCANFVTVLNVIMTVLSVVSSCICGVAVKIPNLPPHGNFPYFLGRPVAPSGEFRHINDQDQICGSKRFLKL
jgi:hypothetical protein